MSNLPDHPRFIFLMGKPAAGKDKQAELLAENNSRAARLSFGDIYRGAKTTTGRYARYHEAITPYVASMDAGIFPPDQLILDVFTQEIQRESDEGKNTFIFTGFPRTLTQARELSQLTQNFPDSIIDFIYYGISDETAQKRLATRRELSREAGQAPRTDDVDEILAERLREYRKYSPDMLLDIIDTRTAQFHPISGEGSIEEIHQQTVRALQQSYTKEKENVLEQPTWSLPQYRA